MRVKAILEKLLTYNLAIQFSWSGQSSVGGGLKNDDRTKLAFSDLAQIRVLVSKVIQYKSIDEIDEKQIKKSIQDYVRRANTRKGRNN